MKRKKVENNNDKQTDGRIALDIGYLKLHLVFFEQKQKFKTHEIANIFFRLKVYLLLILPGELQ